MPRSIYHTFGPHATPRYLWSVLTCIAESELAHNAWAERLASTLGQFFQGDAFTFASGREALLSLLQSLEIRPGEEVIVQGYTCVVVPNAIHASGGVPIFVDIDPQTLNLHLPSVRAAITSRTRAIICQHTFGIPADTLGLRSLCDEYGIALIEDCAHILPEERGNQVGKYGDFLLLSFGRDKAVSAVTGGAVVSRNTTVSRKMTIVMKHAVDLPHLTVTRLLLYPFIYAFFRSFYRPIGRYGLALAKRLKLLIPIVTDEEKHGRMSPVLHRLPNVLAQLALREWQHRGDINDHRRALTQMYLEHANVRHWPRVQGIDAGMALQKFPLFIHEAQALRQKLKHQNIHLDDGWTSCVICPDGVEIDAVSYEWGKDPQAEAACEQILSLPTHPCTRPSDVRRLCAILDPLLL